MILHPTSNPRIIFAGGSILGADCFSMVDGLLIFTGGFTGLQVTAKNFERDGRIPCPHRIHAGAPDGGLCQLIRDDLDYLSGEGCKKIGIHAPNSVEEARQAVNATVEWLEKHPGSVETVYFVDLKDDYFNCFGTGL